MTHTRKRRLRTLPPPVDALEAQRSVYTWQRAFGEISDQWKPLLKRIARLIAKHDDSVAEELVQEALVRLWELDPSRFDERDYRYVKRELLARMRSAAKRNRRQHGGKRRVHWKQAERMRPALRLEMGDDLWDR